MSVNPIADVALNDVVSHIDDTDNTPIDKVIIWAAYYGRLTMMVAASRIAPRTYVPSDRALSACMSSLSDALDGIDADAYDEEDVRSALAEAVATGSARPLHGVAERLAARETAGVFIR